MKRKLIVATVILVLSIFIGLAFGAVTANSNILFNITHTKTVDLTELRDALAITRGVAFANGTGANQVNTVWHDRRTLADGANETLDVNNGTLADAFGDTVVLKKLKLLYLKNNSADANLLVGGAAATQLGLFADTNDILKLRPSGVFIFIAPDINAVDVSANPDLKIAHDGSGSSSLTYDIILLGVE